MYGGIFLFLLKEQTAETLGKVSRYLFCLCYQEAAACPGGAGIYREGLCPLTGLHPDPLPPPAGQTRHPSGPQGQARCHLWQFGEALRLSQPLFPARARGLHEGAGHGGPLLPATCEESLVLSTHRLCVSTALKARLLSTFSNLNLTDSPGFKPPRCVTLYVVDSWRHDWHDI